MDSATMHSLETLSPVLAEALDRAPDAESKTMLETIFLSASRAIDALGEMDLTGYEPTKDECADLSAWEDIAPIVGATISEVNSLLSTIQERIPTLESDSRIDDDLDLFGETFDNTDAMMSASSCKAKETPQDRLRSTIEGIHGIAGILRTEVASFGQIMRKPQVMADRWNLLDNLEAFRGKFKAGVSELLFIAANSLGDFKKEDIVPGYAQDTERSIALRRSLALLAPSIAKENELAQSFCSSDPRSVRNHAARTVKLLDRLMKSTTWPLIWASDRQSFFKTRKNLIAQIKDEKTSATELCRTLEGLDRFLESMSIINLRETLVIHDRHMLPRFNTLIKRARDTANTNNDSSARLLFKKAVTIAWRIFGRDPALDEVIRRTRHLDIMDLDSEDIVFWSESLLEKVRGISTP